MRYLSLFSGIEAASVAWRDLDMEPVAFCEIDEFPSRVLTERFPDVDNLRDITKVDWDDFNDRYGAVELVVGGSPCQSFSIAGGREGLDGESGLMFDFIGCVAKVKPKWVLWENVPGVLSIDSGRAFGTLLQSLDELGYSCSWAILDSQFFGVAQRRRRVFVVAASRESFGDTATGRTAAVLFDSQSLSGTTRTSKQKRKELAGQSKGGVAPSYSLELHQTGSENIGGQRAMITENLSCTFQDQVIFVFDTQANAMISEEIGGGIDGTCI